MRTAEDRKEIITRFELVFGYEPYINPLPPIWISPNCIQIGDVILNRCSIESVPPPRQGSGLAVLPNLRDALFLHSTRISLKHMVNCVNNNWPCILIGPSGSGKSSLVRLLAHLAGIPLRSFSLSPSDDATEILGCFEQADLGRHMAKLLDSINELVVFIVRCASILLDSTNQSNEKVIKSARSKCGKLLDVHNTWQKLIFPNRRTVSKDETNRMCTSVTCWTREHVQILLASSATTLLHQLLNIAQELVSYLDSCFTDTSILTSLPTSSQFEGINSQLRLLEKLSNSGSSGTFEWVDGVLVQAIERGEWLVLENANLCNPTVLDRLNPLLEPAGVLLLNECGSRNGEPRLLRAHPRFRLFLTMDALHGEISRAMRNRCVELCMSLPHTYTLLQDQLSVVSEVGFANNPIGAFWLVHLFNHFVAHQDGIFHNPQVEYNESVGDRTEEKKIYKPLSTLQGLRPLYMLALISHGHLSRGESCIASVWRAVRQIFSCPGQLLCELWQRFSQASKHFLVELQENSIWNLAVSVEQMSFHEILSSLPATFSTMTYLVTRDPSVQIIQQAKLCSKLFALFRLTQDGKLDEENALKALHITWPLDTNFEFSRDSDITCEIQGKYTENISDVTKLVQVCFLEGSTPTDLFDRVEKLHTMFPTQSPFIDFVKCMLDNVSSEWAALTNSLPHTPLNLVTLMGEKNVAVSIAQEEDIVRAAFIVHNALRLYSSTFDTWSENVTRSIREGKEQLRNHTSCFKRSAMFHSGIIDRGGLLHALEACIFPLLQTFDEWYTARVLLITREKLVPSLWINDELWGQRCILLNLVQESQIDINAFAVAFWRLNKYMKMEWEIEAEEKVTRELNLFSSCSLSIELQSLLESTRKSLFASHGEWRSPTLWKYGGHPSVPHQLQRMHMITLLQLLSKTSSLFAFLPQDFIHEKVSLENVLKRPKQHSGFAFSADHRKELMQLWCTLRWSWFRLLEDHTSDQEMPTPQLNENIVSRLVIELSKRGLGQVQSHVENVHSSYVIIQTVVDDEEFVGNEEENFGGDMEESLIGEEINIKPGQSLVYIPTNFYKEAEIKWATQIELCGINNFYLFVAAQSLVFHLLEICIQTEMALFNSNELDTTIVQEIILKLSQWTENAKDLVQNCLSNCTLHASMLIQIQELIWKLHDVNSVTSHPRRLVDFIHTVFHEIFANWVGVPWRMLCNITAQINWRFVSSTVAALDHSMLYIQSNHQFGEDLHPILHMPKTGTVHFLHSSDISQSFRLFQVDTLTLFDRNAKDAQLSSLILKLTSQKQIDQNESALISVTPPLRIMVHTVIAMRKYFDGAVFAKVAQDLSYILRFVERIDSITEFEAASKSLLHHMSQSTLSTLVNAANKHLPQILEILKKIIHCGSCANNPTFFFTKAQQVGFLWMHVSMFQLALLQPSSSIDPVSRRRIKIQQLADQLRLIQSQIRVRTTNQRITAGHPNASSAVLSDPILAKLLVKEAQILQTMKMMKNTVGLTSNKADFDVDGEIVREQMELWTRILGIKEISADTLVYDRISQFSAIFRDISQFLQVVASANKIEQFIDSLESSGSVSRKILSEENVFQEVSLQFITTLQEKYPAVQDFTVPIISSVYQLKHGFRLAIWSAFSIYHSSQFTLFAQIIRVLQSPLLPSSLTAVMSLLSHEKLQSLTGYMDQLVQFQPSQDITAEFSKALKSMSRTTKTLLLHHTLFYAVRSLLYQNRMFSMIKDTILNEWNSSIIQNEERHSVQAFNHFGDALKAIGLVNSAYMVVWDKQEQEKKEKRANEASLYQSKIQAKTTEEIEEEEFVQLFPDYHSNFVFEQDVQHDLNTSSIDDCVSTEINPIMSPSDLSQLVDYHILVFASPMFHKVITSLPNTAVESQMTQIAEDNILGELFSNSSQLLTLLYPIIDSIPCYFLRFNSKDDLDGLSSGCTAHAFVLYAAALSRGSLTEESRAMPTTRSVRRLRRSGELCYDFYHDSNLGEAIRAIQPVSNLMLRLAELLRVWPDNEILQFLMRLCDRILKLPVSCPLSQVKFYFNKFV